MCASASASRWAVETPGLSSASIRSRTSATIRPARRIRSISARDLRVTMSGGPDRAVGRPASRPSVTSSIGRRPSTMRSAPVAGSARRPRPGCRAGRPGEPGSSRRGRRRAGSAATRPGRSDPARAAGWCSRCRRARSRRRSSGRTGDGRARRPGPRCRAPGRPGRPARRGRRRAPSAWARFRGNPSRIAPPTASGGRQPGQQHPDRDVVGHELAALHVAPRLEPDRGAVRDGGPEQVAGRDVRDAEPAGESPPGCPSRPPERRAGRRRSCADRGGSTVPTAMTATVIG